MAMAGIDFSNLREPDYDPSRFKETAKNMDYLKSLVDQQLADFRGREEVVEKNRKEGREFCGRSRSIFYDTEYLQEEQRARAQDLPDMLRVSGAYRRRAPTVADGIIPSNCIAIPAACCPDCASRGLAEYESLKKKKGGDHIYLQDRINDDYRTFETKTGEETIV